MIYALIGPPASGKSTLARVMIRYINAIIVSRDDLREKLYGYTPSTLAAYYDREDLASLEKVITSFQDQIIKHALKLKKDIIVDNMHLKKKYIDELKKYGVPVKLLAMNTDMEMALTLDSMREKSVGEEIIRKYYKDFENLKKSVELKDWSPEPIRYPVQKIDNPKAVIFDLDGTLAINTSGRSPYDWMRVGEDEVNQPVADVLKDLYRQNNAIIILSGRDSVCRPQTEAWLEFHGIPYYDLYMRAKGDNRKDAIVKEEFWLDIIEEFYIVGMFDDRNQVVDHARKLGFTVFQVADGSF